jgi:anti-anti-sigma factor
MGNFFSSSKMDNGSIRIQVSGDFTYDHTGDFNKLVRRIIKKEPTPVNLELDMESCTFVDSGCLGTIAQLQMELSQKNGGLHIINICPEVLLSMKRIRLDVIIPLSPK